MPDPQRYRSNAAECLSAAHEGRQSSYSKLNFSLASLWLALAEQDEEVGNLLASWGMAEPADGLVLSPPVPKGRSL